MKVEASLKNLRIAPRKVRLVTHSLIGVDTQTALLQLEKQVKKSSQPIQVLLKSAIANATNNFGLDENNLYVEEIQVGDGLRLKRWLPRAFGRATPLLRRSSYIRVILEERVPGKNRRAVTKKEEKTVSVPEAEALVTAEEKAGEKAEEKKSAPEFTPEKSVPERVKIQSQNKAGNMGKAVKKVFQRKAS